MVAIKTGVAGLGVYIRGGPEGLRNVMAGRASRGCSVSLLRSLQKEKVEIRRCRIGNIHWKLKAV